MQALNKYILIALCGAAAISVSAETLESKKFALKASAGIGLDNTLSASSYLPSISSKATSCDFGVDFGWTFWEKQNHAFELNVGVAYSPISVKTEIESFDYDYSAPSSADMDGDPYQRYYQLRDVKQTVNYNRLTIPVYASYSFLFSKHFGLRADLGVRMGFKINSPISKVSGESNSYGIYPQYDNLLIDASYLNDFGKTDLSKSHYGESKCNEFSASMLVGVGLEYRICNHFAAEIGLRYDAGLTDLFKGQNVTGGFTNETAPVNYSVEKGQQIKALSDYLKSSKLNKLSLRIAFIHRF